MNFENQIVCANLLAERNEEIYLGIERLGEGQEYSNCIYLGEFIERWTSKVSIEKEDDLISLVYSTLCCSSDKNTSKEQLEKFISECLDYIKRRENNNPFGLSDLITNEGKIVIYFGLYCLYKKHGLVGVTNVSPTVENISDFNKFSFENQILMIFAANLHAEEELDNFIPNIFLNDEIFTKEDLRTLNYIKLLGEIYCIASDYKIKVPTQLKKRLICCRDLSSKEIKDPNKYDFISEEQVIILNYKFISKHILGNNNTLGTPATIRIITRYIQLFKEKGKLYEVLNENYVKTILTNILSNSGKKYASEYQIEYDDFNDLLIFLERIKSFTKYNGEYDRFLGEFLETNYLPLIKNSNFDDIDLSREKLILIEELFKKIIQDMKFDKYSFDVLFEKLKYLYDKKLINRNPITYMYYKNEHRVSEIIYHNDLLNENLYVLGYDFSNHLQGYINVTKKHDLKKTLKLLKKLNDSDLVSLLKEEYNYASSCLDYHKVVSSEKNNTDFYDVYFKFFKLNGLEYQYFYILIHYLEEIYNLYNFTQEEKDELEIEINKYYKEFSSNNDTFIHYLLNNFNRVVELMNYSSDKQLKLKEKLVSYGYKDKVEKLYTDKEKELIDFSIAKSRMKDYRNITPCVKQIRDCKAKYPTSIERINELITILEEKIKKACMAYSKNGEKSYSFVNIQEYFILKQENILPEIVKEIENYYINLTK